MNPATLLNRMSFYKSITPNGSIILHKSSRMDRMTEVCTLFLDLYTLFFSIENSTTIIFYEASMKIPRVYAGCLLSLFLVSGGNALTVPDSGKDNRVEWNLQQNWPTAGKTLDMVHSLDGKFVYILNDRQVVQVFNSQGQLQGSIPVDEGVSAIDIAPQGEMLYLINNKNQSFSSIAVSFVVDVDITGSPVKGPIDAPVTITLFTDFE